MTIRARIRVLLLASSAIYAVVGSFSLYNALQLIEGERWIQHTHEVLGELQGIQVGMNQAESMVRGFVLTGSDAFLEELPEIEQRIPKQLEAVARLTEDNPIQREKVKRLESLITRRLQLLMRGVELRRRQDSIEEYLPVMLEGKAVMGEVAEAVQSMSDEENRLLAVRNARAQVVARFTLVAISAGIAATLLLFLLGRQVLVRMINRPVERLLEGVSQFSAGALGFRISLPPGDELGRIAAALNQMAETRDATEAELKRTSGLLNAIISAMPLAVVGVDGAGRVNTWNPAAVRLFGWTPAEVLGAPSPLICQPPEREREFEMLCTRRDGSHVEGRIITSELVLGDGSTGGLTLIEDITQRKEIEREREQLLATSRRLARRMEAIIHASISIGDEASRADNLPRVLQVIVDWARALTGADYAALGIGTDFSKPFHPWVFSGMDSEVERKLGRYPRPVGVLGWVARQGQVIRVEDVHESPIFQKLPQGHPDMGPFLGIPVRYEARSLGNLYLANKLGRAPFTEEDQRIIELLTAHVGGIIENSNLRQGLETERNRLRFLSQAGESLASSLDYEEIVRIIVGLLVPEFAEVACLDLLVEDAEGRWVVRAAERVAAGPVERREPQRVRFEPGSRHPVLRVIHSREPLVLEGDVSLGLETRDGGNGDETLHAHGVMILPLCVGERTLGALSVASGQATRYTPEDVRLASDLSIRAAVSLEHARLYREAQRALRSREDVLAVVSHDLRNPLSTMKLTAQLLPRVRDNEELFARKVGLIHDAVNQMSTLIEDLVNAGAIEAGRLSLNRTSQEIEPWLLGGVDMLRPEAEKKGQSLELELEPGLPKVQCDLNRMRQVISNLLGNAIKYTEHHGTIRISAWREDEVLVVCIEDSGPGIASEDIPRLFSRYWRVRGTSQAGTGLGLYIVKGIIEAHGGRAWVESEVGRGSRFFFTLPFSRRAEEHAGMAP